MFKNKEIAVIADIHLGLRNASHKWHGYHIEWARWLKTELLRKNVTDILISGDFFHERNEINTLTINVANEILEILNPFNIIMLTGNHDCYYKDNSTVNSISIYKNKPNISVVDTYEQLNEFGRKINIVPWGTDINAVNEGDITFGHFDILSFKFNPSSLCTHGVDPKVLANKAKITFTGHFHLRQEMQIGDSTIIYTGNPFPMDFNDVDDKKGYYIFNLETLKYNFHENKISPKFYYVKDSYKKFKHIRGNFIKLHLSEKALLKELKDNNIDINDSKVNVGLEITKIIDDIRQYFKNNGVEDLVIDKDVIKTNSLDKKVDNSKAVEITDVMKEMVDLLNFDHKDKLLKKLVDLYTN